MSKILYSFIYSDKERIKDAPTVERADRSRTYLPSLEKNRQSAIYTSQKYKPLRVHHSNMQGTSRRRSHRSTNVSDLLSSIYSNQPQWKYPSMRNENERQEWKREIQHHHSLSSLNFLPFELLSRGRTFNYSILMPSGNEAWRDSTKLRSSLLVRGLFHVASRASEPKILKRTPIFLCFLFVFIVLCSYLSIKIIKKQYLFVILQKKNTRNAC